MGLVEVYLLMFFLFLLSTYACKSNYEGPKITVFNVKNYGAVADGRSNDSEAFVRAWEEACQWNKTAKILIPPGEYLVDSMTFGGPCNGNMIVFTMNGNLTPPSKIQNSDYWITFSKVDGLRIEGCGTLDGQGNKVWSLCDHKNPKCQPLQSTLRMEFVKNNAIVSGLTSINSRSTHINIFSCHDLYIKNLKLLAPADSPNTDGIKIGDSSDVRIENTQIGTGDDCISVINRSTNIEVSDVTCGPGHGISAGSMGKWGAMNNDTVIGLKVSNSAFHDTSNGVRIKTWGSSSPGLASNFLFENLKMHNVVNPIIIDQQYCPNPPCIDQTPSHIQVKDVTYRNIWGSSSSTVAVFLRCSRHFPCRNIVLKDINLSYLGQDGNTTSHCSNVIGISYGFQAPSSCL